MYGLSYLDSKSKICKNIIALFPKADNFYDLFGGGFSITHAMLVHRSKDYKQFHFNEIREGIVELVQDAIAGKYNYNVYKPEWVSREDFFANKDKDIYKKIIWSFGNNGEGYLFGKDIEQDKKSMHMAVVFNQFDDYAKEVFGMEKFRDGLDINSKRLFLRDRIKLLGKKRLDLERLEQLEQLERLQQLERVERVEQLHFYNGSYEQVVIKENSIIYCDIPYDGTAKYDSNDKFNRKQFLDWAHEQKEPVFISEYNIDDKRFSAINHKEKRSLLSGNKGNKLIKIEKLYVNKAGFKKVMGL